MAFVNGCPESKKFLIVCTHGMPIVLVVTPVHVSLIGNRPREPAGRYLSRMDATLLIATGETFVNSRESNGEAKCLTGFVFFAAASSSSTPRCWWLGVRSIDWTAVRISPVDTSRSRLISPWAPSLRDVAKFPKCG